MSTQGQSQSTVNWKDLLTVLLQSQEISKVEVKEIYMEPAQKAPLHKHPVPVVGYVTEQDQHFQSKLQLNQLSRQFKVDKFQLIRNFKSNKGVTPNEYLNIIRIEAAKKYIAEGQSLVSAALEAGFYDQSHFSHNFLKYTCFTPGQFQRRCIS